MNIAVWIASVLLAAAYLFIGGTKLLTFKERLAENPSTAGALGLILPWLTRIASILARTAEVVR